MNKALAMAGITPVIALAIDKNAKISMRMQKRLSIVRLIVSYFHVIQTRLFPLPTIWHHVILLVITMLHRLQDSR